MIISMFHFVPGVPFVKVERLQPSGANAPYPKTLGTGRFYAFSPKSASSSLFEPANKIEPV
jgi:hypothetical protein